VGERLWVGLDVGVHMTSACVLNSAGETMLEQDFATSVATVDAVLRALCFDKMGVIGMEAGSTSIHLARGLRRLEYQVAVFECRQVSAYLGIRKNKTDRNDARGIAEVARVGRGTVSEVAIKSLASQRIRSMLVTRQHLLRMRVSGEAGINTLFHLYGGKLPRSTSTAVLRRNTLAEIARLDRDERVDLKEDIEPILDLCGHLRAHIKNLDRSLAALANENEVCRKFMGIPGVGPITALSFYSAIDDPERFRRSADAGPYLGLVPRVRQSGGTVSRFRISKAGNTMTRQHLVGAAMVILRATTKGSELKKWGLGLRERRGWGKARVAVARKLASVMLAMWKSGTEFDPWPEKRAPVVSGLGINSP